MSWHCAHAILYVKFKDGRQDSYPVWENIYRVEAENGKEAHAKAVKIASAAAGDSDASFRWNHRPAEWVFAGIRKIVVVSHENLGGKLANGDELTYSELTLSNEATLRKLVNGEPVTLDYVE
jgi:hypothetical protein